MTFLGTKTRGSVCGCCDGCGVCDAKGDIAFCLRISGVAADGEPYDCAECLELNDTFSGSGTFGGQFILDECNNCILDEDRFPDSINDYRACYVADFTFFGTPGLGIAHLECEAFSQRNYYVRATLLKPDQAGMTPGTAEFHVFVYRILTGSVVELLLHTKYVFPSVPFDCQDVDWTEMDIEYFDSDIPPFIGECDWSAAVVEFKFGGECGNGSPAEDTECCDGIELPGTLLVTTSGSGADVTDAPMGEVPTGTGFQYQYSDDDVLIELRCESGEASISVNVVGGSNTNVPLTIISCDPFHAIGSASGVDVEITS
jgi:hypothetical protein